MKYILLTGRNLMEAISTSETADLIEAIDRGAKLVYLDPRFTKTAAKASEWIPIRPGTDLAFLLAMINVIVTERAGQTASSSSSTPSAAMSLPEAHGRIHPRVG